jgi:hypothetical protein
MIFLFGEKKALIKYYSDNVAQCSNCKSFDLNFAVYKNYFHFFYIPFFPVDEKEVEVLCLKCGESDNRNSRVGHYKAIARTPIYLYSGLLLIIALIATIIIVAPSE